jgi:hypothetical protein
MVRFSFSAITAAVVSARTGVCVVSARAGVSVVSTRTGVLSVRTFFFVRPLRAFFAILFSVAAASAALFQTKKHHFRGAVFPFHSTTGNRENIAHVDNFPEQPPTRQHIPHLSKSAELIHCQIVGTIRQQNPQHRHRIVSSNYRR